MLRFTIRKNFYDTYDNTITILITNLVFCLLIAAAAIIGVILTKAIEDNKLSDNTSFIIMLVVAIFAILTMSVFILAFATVSKNICDGKTASPLDVFKAIKSSFIDGILWGSSCIFMVVIFSFLMYLARPGRFSQDSIPVVSIIICAIIFWIMTFLMQALLFYPALRVFQNNPYPKAVKKCLIIVLDNFVPCVVIMLHNALVLLLSLVTLGLIGGAGMAIMTRVNLIRTILKKYDYIEALKKQGYTVRQIFSRPIPWAVLLEEDVVRYPNRPLSSFIVPKE